MANKGGRSRVSVIWTFFSRLEDERAECSTCNNVLSYKRSSTSNLKRHMRLKHPEVNMYEEHASFNSDLALAVATVQTEKFSDEDEVREESDPSYAPPSTKKKSRASLMWNFFARLADDRAKCDICGRILSFKQASTSNLYRHISRKHPTVNIHETPRKRRKVSEEDLQTEIISLEGEQSDATYILPEHADTKKTTTSPLITKLSQPSEKKVIIIKPQTSEKITNTSKPMVVCKKKGIDEQILRMLLKEYHPFSMVENAEFQKLIKMLNPCYELPSKKDFSGFLMTEFYDKVMEKVKNELKEASYLCMSLDCWSSVKNDIFMTVTVHFISVENILKSYLISIFQLSEEYAIKDISDEIKKVLSDYQLENKIVACVTNNAENIVAAVELCEWWHIPCFAYTLNLVVQSSIEQIKETHCKIKTIVEYFKGNSQAAESLANTQTQMGCPTMPLKQDDINYWSSTYDMFERIVQTKDALLSTITAINPYLPQLNEEDWEIIEKSCDVLKYFKEVTVELSSKSQVAVSKVPLLMKALAAKCEDFKEQNCANKDLNAMIQKLNEEIKLNFQQYEKLLIMWEATLLDPRFKKHGFLTLNKFEEVKQSIIAEACKVQENNLVLDCSVLSKDAKKSDSIWEDFDSSVADLVLLPNPNTSSVVSEVDHFLNQPLLPRSEDPLVWWKENQHFFPRLYEIAKKRLCLIATSVPCETFFSKTGQLMSEKRNRLTTKKMPKIIFLNSNM